MQCMDTQSLGKQLSTWAPPSIEKKEGEINNANYCSECWKKTNSGNHMKSGVTKLNTFLSYSNYVMFSDICFLINMPDE